MLTFECEIPTSGTGLWSTVKKNVKVTNLSVPYISDDGNFGELCVHFDTSSWNCDLDGLIYTDQAFLDQLRILLDLIGLDGSDVSYSEQGMQGDDYVSLDVGGEFLATWRDMKIGEPQ